MHVLSGLVVEEPPPPAAREHATLAPRPVRPRHARRDSSGVRSRSGLVEVEALMHRLAASSRGDVVGSIVREHLATGGKRLRARLALAALAAFGREREDGVAWAAACELLHNATLVHDDLQDGDATRRGKPAAWARHGAAQAINAGDLLLMLPFLAIDWTAASPQVRWSLAQSLAEHATRVVRGQGAELMLDPAAGPDWECYRAAVEGKTSALFQLPVEGAALLAGLEEAEARFTAAAFAPLGVLFQLQDDLIDLYGRKGREAPGSDLRGGRTTALVIEHLTLHPQEAPWLLELLARPREETAYAEVEAAMLRFREGGAVAAVLARIDREAAEAAAAPALRQRPALRALVLELAELILSPIAHLRNGKRPT